MNKEPRENSYGVKFSELHAISAQVVATDVNGDGLPDIVVGR